MKAPRPKPAAVKRRVKRRAAGKGIEVEVES